MSPACVPYLGLTLPRRAPMITRSFFVAEAPCRYTYTYTYLSIKHFELIALTSWYADQTHV